MAVWRAFVDDSGSDGALLNPDFTLKPFDPMDGSTKLPGMISPVTTTGMVSIRGSHCHQVMREFTNFRAEIKRLHGLTGPDLPKIHMRHLWGREAREDNGKNPFCSLDENTRSNISRRAYSLLYSFNKRYNIRYLVLGSQLSEMQDNTYQFSNSERQIREREIIYSRFSKNKIAERFYKKIMNVTMSLVASGMTEFSEFCEENGHDGIVNYDTSESSKGFDSSELYQVLHESGWASRIKQESHGENLDSTLLQIADLLSFYNYRTELEIYRGVSSEIDMKFSKVSSDLRLILPVRKRDGKLTLQPFKDVAIHFLVGRQYLATFDSGWVEKHFKTHSELHADIIARNGEGRGTPMIRESSYQHYLAHGKLP